MELEIESLLLRLLDTCGLLSCKSLMSIDICESQSRHNRQITGPLDFRLASHYINYAPRRTRISHFRAFFSWIIFSSSTLGQLYLHFSGICVDILLWSLFWSNLGLFFKVFRYSGKMNTRCATVWVHRLKSNTGAALI